MFFSRSRPPRVSGIALLCGVALLVVSTVGAARTLDTKYGEVEVDGTPERVVTLYEGALDATVALGATPVAAIATRGGDGVARYMSDRVGAIDIVGTARETNIEAVVAQRPDLILASSRLTQKQYALLSKIAPTIVPANDTFAPDAWQQETRLYGAALGRGEQAESLIAQYEARAAAIRARVSDDTSAKLVRWMPQGPLVMADIIFSSRVLADAGFDIDDDALVPQGRPHSDPLSLENVDRIDSDWLFLATLNADGEQALETARTSPAFTRLNVVKRDQVVPVDGQLWTSASGPIAAEAILDDIAGALGVDAPR